MMRVAPYTFTVGLLSAFDASRVMRQVTSSFCMDVVRQYRVAVSMDAGGRIATASENSIAHACQVNVLRLRGLPAV